MRTRTGDGSDLDRLFLAAIASLLLTELFGLARLAPAPHELVSLDPNAHSPFLAFAVAAMFALHALFHGRALHLAAAALIGLILACLHLSLFSFGAGYWLLPAAVCLYYMGIGSAVMLIWLSWRQRGSPQGRAFAITLKAGALLPIFTVISWTWLEATNTLRAKTFDAVLYRFDASLGFHASALAGRAFEQFPLLGIMSGFIYAGLPLFAGILYGLQCRRERASANILLVFLAIALGGFAIYFLFPAAGPRYLIGGAFPNYMPAVEKMPIGLAPLGPAYRNAMPSLHMAWALALCFGASGMSLPVRVVFVLVVAGTTLATLGLGEHYLIDLVVACPFALAVDTLCAAPASPKTRRIAMICAMLVLSWLTYLAIGVTLFANAGGMHLMAIVATIGVVLWLRLDVSRQ